MRYIDDQRLRDKENQYSKFPCREVKYEDFSPEVRQKLEAAETAAASEKMRRVECPRCKFLLCYAYGRTSGFLNLMCRKCKFTGVLDMSRFKRPKVLDNEVLNLNTGNWVPRSSIRNGDIQIQYDGITPVWDIRDKYSNDFYTPKQEPFPQDLNLFGWHPVNISYRSWLYPNG